MSLHPSLRVDAAGTQQRTVLTRIERIKDLIQKGQWEESQKVTSLPKTKIVKVKARKTKTAKEETAAGTTAASATGAKGKETKAATKTK
ncbi:MAG: small basic protein [Candidatus Omnitrophota bacterium]